MRRVLAVAFVGAFAAGCTAAGAGGGALPTPPSPGSSPPPPPAPPYDLAADRDLRRREGEHALGKGSKSQVVHETFVLVGAPGDGGSFAASAALTGRALDALQNHRFDAHPKEAITVLLFWNAPSYEAFCKSALHEACISPFGFFEPDGRRIVMNAGPGLGTLTHEIVHPLVRADFPEAPTWLDEGLASLFEAPVLPRDGEIHGARNWRLPRLREALGSRDSRARASLATVMSLSDDAFRDDDEALHYATARYLCQWLDARGMLWDFYRAFRDHAGEDPHGERAFASVTNETPAQAESAWEAWLKRL